MMTLTIYTLGDVSIFRAMLNAVAMMFSTGLLSSTTGVGAGAAVATGLLISLVLVLFQSMLGLMKGGGGTSPGILIVLLIVFVGMTVPKVRLQIEDVYTGNVTAVDGIPLGIALPGSVVSSATKRISEIAATAFSTTDGNYISMTEKGFVSPLALLQATRGYRVDGKGEVKPGTTVGNYGTNSYLVASMKSFILDCVVSSPSFLPDEFQKSTNIINYITTHYVGGLTTIYDTTTPQGRGGACSDAATSITNATTAFVASNATNGLGGMLNLNMAAKATPNMNTPNRYSVEDVSDIYSGLVGATFGLGQSAQDFMVNALFMETIVDTYDCAASSGNLSTLNNCTLTMTQAKEAWRTDAGGAGSFFKSIMIKGMNVLHAMFYGFAPLVFIFAMMMSEKGLGVILKFLLFGIWSQTWMPFATIINYFMQVTFREAMEQFAYGTAGLTPQSYWTFYSNVSDTIGFASDMLAATPMLSLALLTGSIYTFTQLSQRWSGRDHVDENLATPKLATVGAVAGGAAMGSSTGRYDFDGQSGIMSRQGTSDLTMSLTSGNTGSVGSSSVLTDKETSQFSSEMSSAIKQDASRNLSTMDSLGFTHSDRTGHGWKQHDGLSLTDSYGRSLKMSNSEAATMQANATAANAFTAGLSQSLSGLIMNNKSLAGGLAQKGIGKGELGQMAQSSIAALSRQDSSFASRFLSGDEKAIDQAIDTTLAAADGIALVGGVLTAETIVGPAAAAAGRSAIRHAATGAARKPIRDGIRGMIEGGKDIFKGMRSDGKWKDGARDIASNLLQGGKSGQEASYRLAMISTGQISDAKSLDADSVSKAASDWGQETFRSGETSDSREASSRSSDTQSITNSSSFGRTLKDVQSKIEDRSNSFTQQATFSSGNSVKQDFNPVSLVNQLRNDPTGAFRKSLGSSIDSAQAENAPLFAQKQQEVQSRMAARYGNLSFANPEEKALVTQAFAASMMHGNSLYMDSSVPSNALANSSLGGPRQDRINEDDRIGVTNEGNLAAAPHMTRTPHALGVNIPHQGEGAGNAAPAVERSVPLHTDLRMGAVLEKQVDARHDQHAENYRDHQTHVDGDNLSVGDQAKNTLNTEFGRNTGVEVSAGTAAGLLNRAKTPPKPPGGK